MTLKGNDLIIYVNGTAIAAAKSCTLKVKANTIEISSPDTGQWRNYITSTKEWDVTASHLVKYTATTATPVKDAVALVGTTVTLKVGVRELSGDTLTGSAIITDWNATATRLNLLQGSFSFQGTGKLE